MRKSSWHARLYERFADLPETWCGYIWGWVAAIVVALFVVLISCAVLYIAVVYLYGWYMLFTGRMFLQAYRDTDGILQKGQCFWFLINAWLICYGIFLLVQWIRKRIPAVKIKICPPINWKP